MRVYVRIDLDDDGPSKPIAQVLRDAAQEIEDCMLFQLFRDPVYPPLHCAVGEVMWDVVPNGEGPSW